MALPPQAPAQKAAQKRLRHADALSAADHLLALREATGLTQDKLATVFGGHGPSVNDWEKGKKRPMGVNPDKIEAWSRRVVQDLALPESAVLSRTKWFTDQEREALVAMESSVAPAEVPPVRPMNASAAEAR